MAASGLLDRNLERLKAVVEGHENQAQGLQGQGQDGLKRCTYSPTDTEVVAFLRQVVVYFKQRPWKSIVLDLHQFFSVISHSIIPTPWTGSNDTLYQSTGTDGWFPNSQRAKPDEEWLELETIFKGKLLEKLREICKFEHGTNPATNGVPSGDTGQIQRDVIHNDLDATLRLLSLFLSSQAMFTEYTNCRVVALRPMIVSWITGTSRGDEENTDLLKSILENEYKLGLTGVFGRESSTFQLLHSICLSPLLEEFIITSQKDVDESIHLYYGFAMISKFVNDLCHRLTPISQLPDCTRMSGQIQGAGENNAEKTKDQLGTVQPDGISPTSKTSVGTLFQPIWTDGLYASVKPSWNWSLHFLGKIPLFVQRCTEITGQLIKGLDQLLLDSSVVYTATVQLQGIEYQIYQTFIGFTLLSKLIAVIGNKHFESDLSQEIRTLEKTLISLSVAIDRVAKFFPKELSSRKFDLLLSSTNFCLSILEMRMEESISGQFGPPQRCTSILDSFTKTRDNFIRLSLDTNLRWTQCYLLHDYSRFSSYSDVKPLEDDLISPPFRMWYWTMRKQMRQPYENGALMESIDQNLGLLLNRIGHTRVSQARQPQLWKDVWFILRSLVDLLVQCGDFPIILFTDHQSQLDGRCRTERSIVIQTRKLLATALVLSLPFGKLYPLAKKGYDTMAETLQRYKKRSIWYLLRPDMFLVDLPLIGFPDPSFPATIQFLLSLLLISRPASSRRRLLTILCLHVHDNALAGLLTGIVGEAVNDDGYNPGRNPSSNQSAVITSLVWILTQVETGANALTNTFCFSARNADKNSRKKERTDSICQECWFPAIRGTITDVIGIAWLKLLDRRLPPRDITFPSPPCGCSLEINHDNGEIDSQLWLLRQRMQLLPASIIHLQAEFKQHLNGFNLLNEVLLWQMKEAGYDDEYAGMLLDRVTSITDDFAQSEVPHENVQAEIAIDSLKTQEPSTRSMIQLFQGRLQTLSHEGVKHVDAVGDYIMANTNRLLEEISKANGDHLDVSWAQSRTSFNPDDNPETPSLDDTIDEGLLAQLTALTELEFRSLLVNRPEFWDLGMPIDETVRKRIECLAKRYRIKSDP